MKLLLTFIICFVVISKSFADVHFAPEINIHYSGFSQVNNASQNIHFKPQLGFKIGFSFDSAIAGNFSMRGGLSITMKGGKHEEHGNNYSLKESVNLNYLEYPLCFGYRFITAQSGYFFVETGPFLRLGLWGKFESHRIDDGVKTDFTTAKVFYNLDEALYKLLDYGWNADVGYMLPFGLYARVDYGIAFANIAKTASSKARNIEGFGITVGYNINKYRQRTY